MPVFSAYWAFDFFLEIVEFAYENKTTKDLFIASARVGEGKRESALHMRAPSLNYWEKEKETSGEWNMPCWWFSEHFTEICAKNFTNQNFMFHPNS